MWNDQKGRPAALRRLFCFCGSTDAQNQIQGEQMSAYSTMQAEAQQVFGENNALYQRMVSAFEPILQAGINQEGMSAPEKAALETEATEGVATNYQKAAAAARATGAGAGGGNIDIPSGQTRQLEGEVANAAAAEQSNLENKITEEDYALGRENYLTAVSGLQGAGRTLDPATSFESNATAGGNAAANTANQIAQADNAPIDAAIGAVGALGGAVISENPGNIFG